MIWEELVAAIAEAGTYATLQEAIDAGLVVVGEQAVTGLALVEGGAAVATSSLTGTALELANASELLATGANVTSAGATLLQLPGAAGFQLGGLLTLDVGVLSAAAAPLAGVGLGVDLYEANPALWTKISQTLLPFCYAENKVQAFLDYVVDTATGQRKPVVLIATAIIDALKRLFEDEKVSTAKTYKWDSPYGSATGNSLAGSFMSANPVIDKPYVKTSGNGYAVAATDGNFGYVYCTEATNYRSDYAGGSYINLPAGWTTTNASSVLWKDYLSMGVALTSLTISELRRIIEGATSEEEEPATPGVRAPTNGAEPAIPLEPEKWPNEPVIIPFPGTEPEPVPVTPITPFPVPFQPIPYEPEKYPDPTPEKPDNWPEEEPWPTIIPFPFQPTEPNPDLPSPNWPDPDKPTIIPWPLPPETPENWPEEPPENWPKTPEGWPEEVPWPEETPWPTSPEEWPEDVPWPETQPEWWPEGEPWPDSPDEWPEQYPWPMPPSWPVKWPDDVPYPWPFPYPKESPEPYTDPKNLPDPDKQVDPYIDPWPYKWPNPYTKPDTTTDVDPTIDPTQPSPKPENPTQPDPTDPYPTPPSGDLEPPIIPLIPLPFSSTTGLISVYHPTQSELLSFAQWLWVTWQDATIEKIWNNPFDGVITLFELYCTPTDVGRKNIRSGFLDSGVSSETISRYTEINCGSIGVPEYYGNYFDYSPYSKCHIFLPFIGIVELNVDDIVGHGVNVTYRIDEYNGSCIAMITCAKSTEVNGVSVDYSTIVYQFSGNCAVELPIAGGSQAAIKAGMLEAAAWGLGSVIGGVMGGSSLGQIGQGLAYGAASAVHSVVSAKSSVQHSGSFGSSYGAMGGKKPYIIVTRPKQIQVPNYNELYGYQAHKMVRVGDCTGYLRCREVHVISPTASDEEKSLIEQFMKTGVYVTE